ncbi:hypothetical protein MTBLM5_90128 [Magnetospirillum sp. LM-5]|nr:hypothetical protein MTBLM5_90128 [Magnetospirillum sp. LM-5]
MHLPQLLEGHPGPGPLCRGPLCGECHQGSGLGLLNNRGIGLLSGPPFLSGHRTDDRFLHVRARDRAPGPPQPSRPATGSPEGHPGPRLCQRAPLPPGLRHGRGDAR